MDRLPWKMESVYTIDCNGITAMTYYRKDDCWEVYYAKKGFPFEFAFGLLPKHTVDEVLEIAMNNADNYLFLFEEKV